MSKFGQGKYRALVKGNAACLAVLCVDEPSSPTSSPTTDTTSTVSALAAAEWHEQEAARLQALKRQTDAETELTASLIEKARTDAEYGELHQITDHARKVGHLKRKL